MRSLVLVLLFVAFASAADPPSPGPQWGAVAEDKIPAAFDDFMVNCFEWPANKDKEYGPDKALSGDDGKKCADLQKEAEKQPFWKEFAAHVAKEGIEISGKASSENEVKFETLADKKQHLARFGGRRLSKALHPLLLELENPFALYQVASTPWPARTIPYCWNLGWNLITKLTIWRGMRHLAAATSVRFRKVDCAAVGHKVRFLYAANTASSAVGYHGPAGGPTQLAGAPGVKAAAATQQDTRFDGGINAFNSFSAAHEIVHHLGWAHTQSRSDRDNYVNCVDGGNANYVIHGPPDDNVYDYGSVMHYGPRAGPPITLAALPAPKPGAKAPAGKPADIGQRVRISVTDTAIINARYAGLPLQ